MGGCSTAGKRQAWALAGKLQGLALAGGCGHGTG